MAKHSVEDHGDLRRYFAAIPHIVFKLGLNPFELALYAHFKQTAGDDGGACWKSRATIAKEAKMSSGMVTKARQALEMPRAELGGRPLITVTEEPSKGGGRPTCRVTITDIWAANMTSRSTSPDDVATSYHDGAIATTSPHDEQRHHTTLATSPHDLKEKPKKKNQEEDKPRSRADMVRSVFGFWQTLLGHTSAVLDGRREAVIARRLKDGYTAEQLMDAIRGCALSDFHMGREPGKPQRHDGITLICRDAEHVDKFIAIYRGNGNGSAMRAKTLREQIAAREAAQ